MKTIRTNSSIYAVSQNEDGTLTVVREYRKEKGEWVKDGAQIQNAGMFISQNGGIEGTLAKCQDMEDIDQYVAAENEVSEQKKAAGLNAREEKSVQIQEEYKRLFAGEVTETNEQTVRALLRYLNTQNWGCWELPKMTIGYACHQYDCDGHTATTIKLDQPIDVCGELGTMFVVGAPLGHLAKYTKIR